VQRCNTRKESPHLRDSVIVRTHHRVGSNCSQRSKFLRLQRGLKTHAADVQIGGSLRVLQRCTCDAQEQQLDLPYRIPRVTKQAAPAKILRKFSRLLLRKPGFQMLVFTMWISDLAKRKFFAIEFSGNPRT